MGWIFLENMEFHAKHGFYKEEQIIGNTFIVNIGIQYDLSIAGKSDHLEDTINYQKIYDLTKREMGITSKLLEHLASRIIFSIKTEFEQIEKIRVKVTKKNPPLGGIIDTVSIEIEE